MDYGRIISFGFSNAWKYKSLWILGFFVSGFGGTGSFNPGRFGGRDIDIGNVHIPGIVERILENPFIIFALVAFALAFILIFTILGTISVGALIEAAKRFKHSSSYRFGEVFRVGLAYFWRLLAILILVIIVMFAFIILLVLLGAAAFMFHKALGILSLLILIPMFIVGLFIVIATSAMAERQIVVKDRPVFDAIGEGFSLWTANLGHTVLYALIYLGISIGVFIATMVLLMFVAMPFVAIGLINLLMALITGIPVVLLFLIIVEGFTGSAMHMMTTEFYFQIAARSEASALQPAGTGPTPPPPPASSPPPPEPAPPQTPPPGGAY